MSSDDADGGMHTFSHRRTPGAINVVQGQERRRDTGTALDTALDGRGSRYSGSKYSAEGRCGSVARLARHGLALLKSRLESCHSQRTFTVAQITQQLGFVPLAPHIRKGAVWRRMPLRLRPVDMA